MAHSFAPHDDGSPVTITPRSLADYFEVITRAVFNAGLSWKVVESKWDHMATRLRDFDPEAVAAMGDDDIAQVLDDPGVVRSRNKVRGTVTNARTFVEIVDGHNGFAGWLHSFDTYDDLEAAMIRQFKWVGEFGAYWSLYTLGEDVPDYLEWCRARGRTPPAGLADDDPKT